MASKKLNYITFSVYIETMGRKKGGNRRYKGRGSNYTASSTKTILRKAIEEGDNSGQEICARELDYF